MGMKPIGPRSSTEDRINHLLDELCEQWGFCSDRNSERDSIATTRPLTADEFTRAVLRSDGLNPDYEKKWFKPIKARFIELFGNEIRDDEGKA